MPSWNHSSAADEHNSHTMWQGVNQPSPIESTYTEGSTYTDGCTYPDPTGFGRQTRSNGADALPKRSPQYGPYFQTPNSKANEVQLDDPFARDDYWSRQSETWDADQEQYLAELDPFPEVTQHSGIQGHSRSWRQLSTATREQTRESFPDDSSSSRQANLPMGVANTMASGNIYCAGNTFGYGRQNISYPTHCASSSLEEPFHGTYPVGYPSRHAPEYISCPNYPTSPTYPNYPNYSSGGPLDDRLHSILSHPYSPGDVVEQPSQTVSDHDSSYASAPQSPSPPMERKRATRHQRASRSKRARTAHGFQGEKGTTSVLGRKKAELGAAMGSDYRRREKTKVENGVLLGLVDNEWKPAGYHLDYRMRLILRDAQQPGAPAPPTFPPGIPPNYTSYSPITQGWNDDNLWSMRDSRGRHAFLMPAPPTDWQHNPHSGYLTYNGLVMLDQNNRPVKDYPGAPLTLSYDATASLIEGLRRYFGMTYSDITGRMPPQRHTSTGIRPIRGVTLLSTRIGRFYERHKDSGLRPWHDRKKDKGS